MHLADSRHEHRHRAARMGRLRMVCRPELRRCSTAAHGSDVGRDAFRGRSGGPCGVPAVEVRGRRGTGEDSSGTEFEPVWV